MRPTIRVYDVQKDRLVLIGIVNLTTSVIWKRAWSTYGDFEIHMGEPDDLLKAGRFVCVNSDPEKFGIIEKAVDDSDGRYYNSTQDFTIHGFTADFLLTDRITVPSAEDNSKHNGYLTWGKQPAEAIMYDLVKTQVVNPTDAARKNPLVIIADHPTPTGHEVAFQSRFKPVATDLYTLSAATGLGWALEPDFDTGKLVFKVLNGTDRTQHIETDQNGIPSAAINPNAYIFNQNNKTVKKHTYTHDLSAYKNMAYVAGEGDGAARKIIKLGDDLAGLNRHEVLVDARDIQSSKVGATVTGTLSSGAEGETESGDVQQLTDAQLTERGFAKLQTDYREVHNYEYQAVTEDYRTYWDLGDTCTYIDKKNGVSMDQQITAVEETYEGGNMAVEATFGYTENTVSTQVASAQSATLVERKGISKEFDRIDANFVNTNELFAKHAYALGLDVDEATIAILRAKMADFDALTAQRGVFGSLQAISAIIDDLKASKIDTSKLTLTSPSGNLKIENNRITISDGNKVRAIIGMLDDGSYTYQLMNADGDVVWDASGLKQAGTPTQQEQFYLSASETAQEGGTWVDTQPELTAGRCLWTRTHITWPDGSTLDTTPMLLKALNKTNEAAIEAKQAANSIRAIVRETDEGIEISKPESEFTTVTTNDSYLIKQNGKVVTEISNSEQIYYHEVDGENRPYGKISVEQDGEFRNFNIIGIGKNFAPAIHMSCSNTKSMISIMADANNPKVGSFGVYMSQFGNNGNPTSFLLYNNYNLINYLYPIGSYYMSDDPTSPAKLFGLIWEKLAEGTVLMSAGDTYTAGQVYGENEHTLTVDEMPSHTHKFYMGYGNTTSGPHDALFYSKMQVQPWGGDGQYLQRPAGDGQPHNNMQKSYATNIWRRIG